MAKGGLNLNPGANPTLVAAATAAGSAMKLPDYSETFQAAADSYHKSMMASAEMWGEIAEAAGTVVEAMAKDAAGPEKSKDAQNLYDNPAFESLKNEMEENKKNIFKNSPGNPFNWGNEEAKTNYKEAVKKQNDLNAKLEHMAQNVAIAINSHKINPKTGLTWVDTEKMQKANLFGLQINHALQRTLEGNTTDLGMSLKVEENADGESRFYLYHDPTKIKEENYKPIAGLPELGGGSAGVDSNGRVLGEDGEPLNFSADEIAQMNILRDPNLLTNMNNDINKMRNLGGNSKIGDFTNYERNVSNNFAKKYSGNQGAWYEQTFFGDSFFEEATGTGTGTSLNAPISVEMFSALKKVPGIFDGVKDTDDVEGPSIGDFQNADNMKVLQLNLFNPGDGNYKKENTAIIFEGWYNNKMATVFDDGFKAGPNFKGSEGNEKELTATLNSIVTSWKSGNFENLALPYLNRIYFNKDGDFGENSYILETSDDIFHFDASKSSNLKKILMKYAGNNKSLQNVVQNIDYSKVKFGSSGDDGGDGGDDGGDDGNDRKTLKKNTVGKIWVGGTKWSKVQKVGGIWYIKTKNYFGTDDPLGGYTKVTDHDNSAKILERIAKKYK